MWVLTHKTRSRSACLARGIYMGSLFTRHKQSFAAAELAFLFGSIAWIESVEVLLAKLTTHINSGGTLPRGYSRGESVEVLLAKLTTHINSGSIPPRGYSRGESVEVLLAKPTTRIDSGGTLPHGLRISRFCLQNRLNVLTAEAL